MCSDACLRCITGRNIGYEGACSEASALNSYSSELRACVLGRVRANRTNGMCVHTNVYVCICVCVFMCPYMYMYAYTHTHRGREIFQELADGTMEADKSEICRAG